MVLIKCKACGKRYDYHEHGCCPGCGAFNRAPRRNRVDADGTVHHLSDVDFLENTEARRRSQSGKVCFEREECHEDQARKVRRSLQNLAGAAEARAERFSRGAQERNQNKSGLLKIILIAGLVGLIVNIFSVLLTMCNVGGFVEDITDEIIQEVGSAIPDEIWDGDMQVVKSELDGEKEYTSTLGGTFLWWDKEAAVTEVTMDESDEATKVELVMYREDDFDEPAIYYITVDGWQEIAFCERVMSMGEGLYSYYFLLDGRAPGTECSAYFSGYNDGVYCEVSVPLQ